MKRHIPGLHSWQPDDTSLLEGLFLTRVDKAFFRWQPRKPYLELRFVVLEPKAYENRLSLHACIALRKPWGSLAGFFAISTMMPNSSNMTK